MLFKSPRFVPFGANLTHFGPKFNTLKLSTDECCECDLYPDIPGDQDTATFETEGWIEVLNQMSQRCKKKADHAKFLPYKDLQKTDLPPSGQSEYGWFFLNLMAARTVRLITVFTSDERPDNSWGMDHLRGKSDRRYGTGLVIKFDDGKIVIRTAAHVVFNTEEAEKTTVNFFFDDDDDRSKVVKGKGVEVIECRPDLDLTYFTCRVESEEIYEQLKLDIPLTAASPESPQPGFSLGVIISHPHGTAKKVSFGEKTGLEEFTVKKPISEEDLCEQYLLIESVKTKVCDKSIIYFLLHNSGMIKSLIELYKQTDKISDDQVQLSVRQVEKKCCSEEKPTGSELEMLQKAWTQVKETMEEKETEIRQRYSQLPDVLKERAVKKEMKQFCSETEQLSDHWKTELFKLFDEFHNCCVEVKSNNVQSLQQKLNRVFYTMATCGGSSGSCVSILNYLSDKQSLQVYYATHTNGSPDKGNRSDITRVIEFKI